MDEFTYNALVTHKKISYCYVAGMLPTAGEFRTNGSLNPVAENTWEIPRLQQPLPEYHTVWEQGNARGNKFEKVCCPAVNSGFFTAMVEMGDIMGTFVGHDHINDFEGELYGIRLCYGRSTGYNSYGKEGMELGACVIRLHAHEREFETWIRLGDGTVLRYFD